MAEDGHWRDDETDPERFPRYNQQAQWEQASLETCTVMNLLGYGSHIRQKRRDTYRESDLRNSTQDVTVITTGSKAEGLTSFLESDRDNLFVLNDVMCLANDAIVNYETLPRGMTVLTLNTGICYHGHCRLFLEERPGANTCIHPIIQNALCAYDNERALLSSDQYVNGFDAVKYGPTSLRHERAGPSMPSSIHGILHVDMVYSLRCYCPSILRKWSERRRHWPPPDVVKKVVSMGAFVTPVGFKGSEHKHVEWRICFNKGENELLSSFNNTQVYIYVILKMVVKDVLKPLKKELTSYTVKNIVLWLAENNPQEMFNERTLFYWLRAGLGELRSALLTEHLSYYMIQERNLMAACGLEELQKRTWIQMVTDMIEEGPKLLLRIPKMRQAINSHPEPLLWYSKKRVELELLQLKYESITLQCEDGSGVLNESGTLLQAIRTRMSEIVREVHHRMCIEGSRVDDRKDVYKSMLM